LEAKREYLDDGELLSFHSASVKSRHVAPRIIVGIKIEAGTSTESSEGRHRLAKRGCVHRFHEVIKPLPNGCVEACVRGGSPLVVLTKNEQVYHPISAEMPDVDVRQKLLPFAGKLVKVTGHAQVSAIPTGGVVMKDLRIALDNRPGALAEMGDALGGAGVSIEGGGAWVVNGQAVAHFLFQDGAAARSALQAAGIRVLEEREVLVQRLNQTEPGQLGKVSRRMAEAGVNIEVLYSDHDHQLILVVDDIARGRAVSETWTREQAPPDHQT
jgi:hypothetical protein